MLPTWDYRASRRHQGKRGHRHSWSSRSRFAEGRAAAEGAFRDTFGMTSEEFYGEFERFLELPLEEQVRILPGGRGGEG